MAVENQQYGGSGCDAHRILVSLTFYEDPLLYNLRAVSDFFALYFILLSSHPVITGLHHHVSRLNVTSSADAFNCTALEEAVGDGIDELVCQGKIYESFGSSLNVDVGFAIAVVTSIIIYIGV